MRIYNAGIIYVRIGCLQTLKLGECNEIIVKH